MNIFETLLGTLKQECGDVRPWPVDGQEFDVEILVEGDVEDPEPSIVGDIPKDLSEVLSEYGKYITSDLFNLDESPKEPGRYRAKLQFVVDGPHTDWESGIIECNYGLKILTSERIQPSMTTAYPSEN